MSEEKKEELKMDDVEKQLRAMELREAFANAIENLPENYLILIEIGKDRGGVCLEDPDGSFIKISSEGKLSSDINNAVNQAIAKDKEGPTNVEI